jgi:hypothetical protein
MYEKKRKKKKKPTPNDRRFGGNTRTEILRPILTTGWSGRGSEIRVITKQINVCVFQQMFTRGGGRVWGKRNSENCGHL